MIYFNLFFSNLLYNEWKDSIFYKYIYKIEHILNAHGIFRFIESVNSLTKETKEYYKYAVKML